MITLVDILSTTFVPFAAAVVVALLLSRWRTVQPLAPAVSVAFGFWAGKFATDVRDAWGAGDGRLTAIARIAGAGKLALQQQAQPAEAHDWLALLGLVAAILLGLATANQRRSWFLLSGLAMATLIPVRMLWSSVYFVRDWTTAELLVRMTGIVICLAVPVMVLPRWSANETRPRHVLMPILVGVGLLAAAMTFMLTGSKTYGELGGVLSFAFLGAWCGGLLSGTPWGYNDLPVVAVLLGGMAVLASAFSATPLWQVLVLGAGMTVASVVAPNTDSPSPKMRIVAVLILMAAVLSVVGLAGWRFLHATRTENPYSQYMK